MSSSLNAVFVLPVPETAMKNTWPATLMKYDVHITTIAGTEPETLSPEAKLAFETADVILSKGQANVETLYGCGKNIYYIFLIKCQRFVDYFQKEKLTPMLLRDKRRR